MTLEEACRDYYGKVYRHCLKELYFNELAAEDATQETFAAFCYSWEKLNHDDFEPWLWKTANNQILKAKADHTKRIVLVVTSDDTYPDPATEPDMHEQIIRQKIEERIDQYPPHLASAVSAQSDTPKGIRHEEGASGRVRRLSSNGHVILRELKEVELMSEW